MSIGSESPKSEMQQDITQRDQSEDVFNKHRRFNLRKINLPPLNKDHVRALDGGIKDSKNTNRGFTSVTTAENPRNQMFTPDFTH